MGCFFMPNQLQNGPTCVTIRYVKRVVVWNRTYPYNIMPFLLQSRVFGNFCYDFCYKINRIDSILRRCSVPVLTI